MRCDQTFAFVPQVHVPDVLLLVSIPQLFRIIRMHRLIQSASPSCNLNLSEPGDIILGVIKNAP
jgi:hypothetical protein